MSEDRQDDAELLSPDWLVSLGGTDYPYHSHVEFHDGGESVMEVYRDGTVWLAQMTSRDKVRVTNVGSRGEFRTLVRGMKFPVREGT